MEGGAYVFFIVFISFCILTIIKQWKDTAGRKERGGGFETREEAREFTPRNNIPTEMAFRKQTTYIGESAGQAILTKTKNNTKLHLFYNSRK